MGRSGLSSLGGPSSSNSVKWQSYLNARKRGQRPLVAESLSQASLAADTRAGRSATSTSQRPATAASSGVRQADLNLLVLKLSGQVEELTALVAAQQKEQDSRNGDAE
jgi:hypothetical protein